MGTDASSMKDSAMDSETISNISTAHQKEQLNHINQFIEQKQINDKMKEVEYVKVEKYYH